MRKYPNLLSLLYIAAGMIIPMFGSPELTRFGVRPFVAYMVGIGTSWLAGFVHGRLTKNSWEG